MYLVVYPILCTISFFNILIFRKNIQNAKIQHDKEYMEYEWDLNFTKPPPKTNDIPYYPNEKSAIITKLRNSEIYQYTKTQNNLIPEGKSWVGKF